MPTHVYANNNEVASKAADGKSIAAFPDVCFSPPAPPVGPMPLPYPNTGEVKDTDSGTAKVFVKDKMSGMAGDSHMTKSMGDEAATQNFNKGMITGALQGKCYFGLWSMDVQMEGKGVPRHLDMVTHNHGSMMGNDPCGTDMDEATLTVPPKVKQTSISKRKVTYKFKIYFVNKDFFLFDKIIFYKFGHYGISVYDESYNVKICESSGKVLFNGIIPPKSPLSISSSTHHISVSLSICNNFNSTDGSKVIPSIVPSNIRFADISKYEYVVVKHVGYTGSVRGLYQSIANNSKYEMEYVFKYVERPVVIFIGGFFDNLSSCLYDEFDKFCSANKHRCDSHYFTYNGLKVESRSELSSLDKVSNFLTGFTVMCRDDVIDLIETCKKNGREVILIGHSWGGDTAANVVVPKLTCRIDLLVTLDPVSRQGMPLERGRVERWVNVYVDYEAYDKSDNSIMDNEIAQIGNPWGSVPIADVDKVIQNIAHGYTSTMLNSSYVMTEINSVLNKYL